MIIRIPKISRQSKAREQELCITTRLSANTFRQTIIKLNFGSPRSEHLRITPSRSPKRASEVREPTPIKLLQKRKTIKEQLLGDTDAKGRFTPDKLNQTQSRFNRKMNQHIRSAIHSEYSTIDPPHSTLGNYSPKLPTIDRHIDELLELLPSLSGKKIFPKPAIIAENVEPSPVEPRYKQKYFRDRQPRVLYKSRPFFDLCCLSSAEWRLS